MRERLIQVGKMLLYLLFYILMQRMVAYVVAFVYSFVDSVRYGKSHPGESIPQEVMEQMIDRINEFLFNNSAWFTVVSVILTLLCLWVFFLIRKKKFTEEVSLRKLPVKQVIPLALVALGTWLIVEFGLCLLPIPAEVWDAYNDAAQAVTVGSVWARLLGICIFAPIGEEVIFRGLGFFRLRRAWSVPHSVILSALCFGLVHNEDLIWIGYAGAIGLILGLVAWRTDTILATILVHGLFNVLGSFGAYLFTRELSTLETAGLTLAGVVILALSLVWLSKNSKIKAEPADQFIAA